MTDRRTLEQIDADDNLTAAIEAVNEAYYGTDGLVLEYVVVFAEHVATAEAEGVQVGWITRDGCVAPHRALGLLEYTTSRIRRLFG